MAASNLYEEKRQNRKIKEKMLNYIYWRTGVNCIWLVLTSNQFEIGKILGYRNPEMKEETIHGKQLWVWEF